MLLTYRKTLLYCVVDQTGGVFCSAFFHQPIAMAVYGTAADIQDITDLLVRVLVTDEL